MGLLNWLVKGIARREMRAVVEAGYSVEAWRRYVHSLGRKMGRPGGLRIEPATGMVGESAWLSFADSSDTVTLVYLHGGGYVAGTVEGYAGLVGRIAKAAGVRALLVDYRLAPEHPFPAAIDDVRSVYGALLADGVEPSRIVFAGDSAGGGLTLASLLSLRDHGLEMPAGALLLSPWLDLTCSGDSMAGKSDRDPILGSAGLETFAAHYLAGTSAEDPLASPLFADLAGLPPLLIQVGTDEVLLDDAIRLAARAESAGVATTLTQWRDMVHVFQFLARILPEARRAIAELGAFARARAPTGVQVA